MRPINEACEPFVPGTAGNRFAVPAMNSSRLSPADFAVDLNGRPPSGL
jgi:hypothetical protein